MHRTIARSVLRVLVVVLLGGCATGARQLMPTPTLYQQPGGQPVFAESPASRPSPDLDLLYVTDRAAQTEAEAADSAPSRYGQERAPRIAFGSAQVRVVPGLDWETLREQSQLANRTRDVNLELAEVQELGAFPDVPYQIT